MEFKKYGSIENSYQIKTINKVKEEGKADGEWVVQEKVHGSNFSIWTDGKEVKCAKRSGWINEDENFNSWETVVTDEFEKKVLDMFSNNCKESLVLCGELFGGNYPHPDVVKHNVSRVQKGVFYCPDVKFYCFDILIDGKLIDIGNVGVLCEMYGIFYANTLFKGSLEEALTYENKFQTTIPAKLGLPEIEGNFCEGTVIKPVTAKFLGNGSRIIFKNKNDTFQERKQEGRDDRIKAVLEPLEGKALEAYEGILRYITENRLQNVLSKLGEVTQRDFGKISGLFNKDIIEDFQKDYGEDFEKLDKADRKKVTKEMSKAAATLIRDNFVNIINGEF